VRIRLEGLVEFLRGHDRRADLADDDAGCGVGNAHQLAGRQLCGDAKSGEGQHRVAGA
jgi:hypothetical protein